MKSAPWNRRTKKIYCHLFGCCTPSDWWWCLKGSPTPAASSSSASLDKHISETPVPAAPAHSNFYCTPRSRPLCFPSRLPFTPHFPAFPHIFPLFPKYIHIFMNCLPPVVVGCLFSFGSLERAISISSLLLLFYFRCQLPRVQLNSLWFLCVFLRLSRISNLESRISADKCFCSWRKKREIICTAITLSGLENWTLLWSFLLQLEFWNFPGQVQLKICWNTLKKVATIRLVLKFRITGLEITRKQ